MKKILLGLPLVLASNFTTTINQNYTLNPDGAAVSETITITNLSDQLFPTGYSYLLNSDQISSLSITGNGNPSPKYERINQSGTTKVDLYFTKPLVGKTKSQTYTIEYLHPKIKLTKTFPQYQIPKPINPTQDTQITTNIIIPKTSCPNPQVFPKQLTLTQTDTHANVSFNPNDINQSVTLLCQSLRHLQLSLQYDLVNPSMTPIETQITLPPDTSFQRLIFDSITPQPLRLSPDTDGNRIATYKLEPKQNLSVTVSARAIVTNLNQVFPSTSPDTKDPSDTESIYNNVVLNPKITPDQSVDSFITLARDKKIATRIVLGVIEADNLIPHKYAEWYDPNSATWFQVDPSLQKTQPGYSYWPVASQTHLALAINGHNSPPYPADVAKLKVSDIDSFDFPKPIISAANKSGKLIITNLSPFAPINLTFTIKDELGNTEDLTIDRLEIDSQRIIPTNISLTKAHLESENGIIPISSTQNPIHQGLTLASILAGTAGGIAVLTRRLLVSRPKR